MKYYLAADGSGTKLLSVLYDENLNIISTARTAGVNSNFKPIEQVEAEVGQMVTELLSAHTHISNIEALDMSFVGETDILLHALQKRVTINRWCAYGEEKVALASAGYRYGVVTQAGTGSDAFLLQEGLRDTVGGWGAFLGDEGGGYDMGIQTLKAAIYSQDGRGPKTMIGEILMEEWNLSDLWELIDRMNQTPDWRGLVASATRIAAKAAAHGDIVALQIFEKAGRELAFQVLTLLRRHNGIWQGPVVASGGAWKGCGRMYECFREEVLKEYSEAQICRPIFEPLVGSVILRCFANGQTYEEVEVVLKDKFGQYLL